MRAIKPIGAETVDRIARDESRLLAPANVAINTDRIEAVEAFDASVHIYIAGGTRYDVHYPRTERGGQDLAMFLRALGL